MSDQIQPVRRTIRRYAHEIYPHGSEGETRDLAVEVPYLYAQAIGLDVWGTSWNERSAMGIERYLARTRELIAARREALVDLIERGAALSDLEAAGHRAPGVEQALRRAGRPDLWAAHRTPQPRRLTHDEPRRTCGRLQGGRTPPVRRQLPPVRLRPPQLLHVPAHARPQQPDRRMILCPGSASTTTCRRTLKPSWLVTPPWACGRARVHGA